MSLPLSFHPSVRDEANDGYRWYEARQAGLGRDFLDEVEAVLEDSRRRVERLGARRVTVHAHDRPRAAVTPFEMM